MKLKYISEIVEGWIVLYVARQNLGKGNSVENGGEYAV
jgi:hypothetical protein